MRRTIELAAIPEHDRRSPLADLGAAIGVSLWTFMVALLVVGSIGAPDSAFIHVFRCDPGDGPSLAYAVTATALVAGVVGMLAGVRVSRRRRWVGLTALAANAILLLLLNHFAIQSLVRFP